MAKDAALWLISILQHRAAIAKPTPNAGERALEDQAFDKMPVRELKVALDNPGAEI